MAEISWFIQNDVWHSSDNLTISPNNRAFKYGDGFFETMKIINGIIIFEHFHFERLFSSLQTLQFDTPSLFTKHYFQQRIQELVERNSNQSLAHIRLTFFRSDGNLYNENNYPNYIIQSWHLPSLPSYKEQGLLLDVYNDAKISCDIFSNIKNNNYLPYAMAAIWCRKKGLDDALLLNVYNRVAEATTSNLFIVKDGMIKTPALSEGCIAGVTRRYLLQCFEKENIAFEQTAITEENIFDADEIFSTNTGFYIQWVKRCSTKIYKNETSKSLYQRFITPLL